MNNKIRVVKNVLTVQNKTLEILIVVPNKTYITQEEATIATQYHKSNGPSK